jgi:regulator of protease activity HflC (stomatin/prohibitin superfamily)
MVLSRIEIKSFEVGLRFVRGEFAGLIEPGARWIRTVFPKTRVFVVSRRDPFLRFQGLDLFVRNDAFKRRLEVLDLSDQERALVWVDGRFQEVLKPGLYAYWTGLRDVVVETVSIDEVLFEHKMRDRIEAVAGDQFDVSVVPSGSQGVLFVNGEIQKILPAGRYLRWAAVPGVNLTVIDTRETEIEIAGQDIMTADNVTVRVNAGLCLKVRDVKRVVSVAESSRQVLYREAQLALRESIGTRTLAALLDEKGVIGPELVGLLEARARSLGYEVVSIGVRDIILPGEMKDLLNKVTEAKAVAEANLITRREETAAMRSQANTAKMLESNPTLMRLRELEVVERVSENAKLQVVLGEQGLADRIVNLI